MGCVELGKKLREGERESYYMRASQCSQQSVFPRPGTTAAWSGGGGLRTAKGSRQRKHGQRRWETREMSSECPEVSTDGFSCSHGH